MECFMVTVISDGMMEANSKVTGITIRSKEREHGNLQMEWLFRAFSKNSQ